MKTFIYREAIIAIHDFFTCINQLGEEGWELIQADVIGSPPVDKYCIFKKEK